MKTIYLYFSVFVLGGAVLVVEILGTRVISPYFGSSVYTWSSLITVTLASLALGYYFGGLFADRRPSLMNFLYEIMFSAALVLLIPFFKKDVLEFASGFGIVQGSLVGSTILFMPCLIMLSATGPMAIKLVTTEMGRLGHGVGRIYAFSTMGSVIGALISGFLLVPAYSAREILYFVSLLLFVLGAVGFYLARKPVFSVASAVVVLALYSAVTKPANAMNGELVYRSPSFYGEIAVVDSDESRFMLIDGIVQGVLNKKDRLKLEDLYTYFEILPLLRKDPRDALFIGLGAGVIPDIEREFYGIDPDIVEINPKVPIVASTYFGFRSNDKVMIEDGRMFIEKPGKRYDIIVLDAFGSECMPYHLFSLECFSKINGRLKPGGLFAINSFASYRDKKGWISIYKTLQTVYKNVYVFPLEESEIGLFNAVFLASNDPIELEKIAMSKARKGSLEGIRKAIGKVIKDVDATELAKATVLTDDFNPLDDLYKGIVMDYRRYLLKMFPEVLPNS